MNIYNIKYGENWIMIFIPFFTPLFAVVSMEIDYLGEFSFLLGKTECCVVCRHCRFSELENELADSE